MSVGHCLCYISAQSTGQKSKNGIVKSPATLVQQRVQVISLKPLLRKRFQPFVLYKGLCYNFLVRRNGMPDQFHAKPPQF
jgi:hypothetical protein